MKKDTPKKTQQESKKEGVGAKLHPSSKSKKADEKLSAQLHALQETLKKTEEENLRLRAEMQTLQRRVHTENIKAKRDGLVSLAERIAESMDNLERALENMEEGQAREGVDLTYKSLLDNLRSFDITQINPTGEEFNPAMHEAIGRVSVAGSASNTIIMVVQKGYRLGEETLIRPARVQVSK